MADFVLGSRSAGKARRPAKPARPVASESGKAAAAQPPSGESARESRPAATGLERGLGLLLGAVTAALLLVAAFILAPTLFRVQRFEVKGTESLRAEAVVDASLVRPGAYLFSVDPRRAETALLSSPRIAKAHVERRFPNALRIEIVERKAVALALAEIEGRSRLVALDESGVAFAEADLGAGGAPGSVRIPAPREAPVLSGLRFEDFRLGAKLPPSLAPLFSALAEIERSAPALLAAFSEIRIVQPRYGELELLLYPIHNRIPVRTTASLNEGTLRSIILVLDVLSSRGLAGNVEEIDFRTGTIVYRTKEGQSG